METLPAGHKLPTILPDTKLVWSLEENSQQESGLPREFTFVFLMERVRPSRTLSTSSSITVTPALLQRSRAHSSATISTSTNIVDVARGSIEVGVGNASTIVTKTEKHHISLFHHEAPPQNVPSTLAEEKGKEQEKVPYDIGQSELSLELLDKSHGIGHPNQSLDGAGVMSVEAPKYPALDIRNLPRDVLPGSDQTTFTAIRQDHSEFAVQINGNLPQEALSTSSDDQAVIEHCEYSVQDDGLSSEKALSSSPSGQIFVDPGERTIPFPALDPSAIPTVVLSEDSDLTLDGAGDRLRRMHLSPYEAEVAVYKNEVDPKIKALDSDYDTIFTPIRLDIVVQPRINGSLDKKLFGRVVYQSLIGTSNHAPKSQSNAMPEQPRKAQLTR